MDISQPIPAFYFLVIFPMKTKCSIWFEFLIVFLFVSLIGYHCSSGDDSSSKSTTNNNNNPHHNQNHHQHNHHHRSHPDILYYSHDHSLLSQFNGTSFTHTNYCPASALINFEVSGYFNYPLTFFENSNSNSNKRFQVANAHIHTKSPLFNCTTNRPAILGCDGESCYDKPGGCPHYSECLHVCSPQIQIKCPVFPEALDAAFNRSSAWVYNSSKPTHTLPLLYHMRQVLSDPLETVRVIVFGGSAAQGAEAFGCFCDLEHDSKCEAFNHASYQTSHSPNHG